MKPLILVVEDEPPLQKLLAYNLEAAGFAVAQAYDGEEAMTFRISAVAVWRSSESRVSLNNRAFSMAMTA